MRRASFAGKLRLGHSKQTYDQIATPTLPSPIEAKSLAMSGDNSLRFEEEQSRSPIVPRERQTHRKRSAQRKGRLCPRLERCRTKSLWRRASISACRTARARKQSRREKSKVSMAREGYPSRRCKCNNFNVYGVFGRDNLASANSLGFAILAVRRIINLRSLNTAFVRSPPPLPKVLWSLLSLPPENHGLAPKRP